MSKQENVLAYTQIPDSMQEGNRFTRPVGQEGFFAHIWPLGVLEEKSLTRGIGQVLMSDLLPNDQKGTVYAGTMELVKRLSFPELAKVAATAAGNATLCFQEEKSDGSPLYHNIQGYALEGRSAFSTVVTKGDRSVSYTYAHAYYSVAVAYGDESASITRSICSVAVNRGRNSLSVAEETLSAAITMNAYSVADCLGSESVAVAIKKESMAVCRNYYSGALTVCSRSKAIAEGIQSFALCNDVYSSAEVCESESVAIALENKCRVKACEGSGIVCVLRDGDGKLIKIRSALVGEEVDGIVIEAGKWYGLDGAGCFVQVP